MALFGNKESAENAALQQQLAAANGTLAELRGWVTQLRGTPTSTLEAELRLVKTAVDQARNEYSTLTTARHRLQAEVNALQAGLVETREIALLQEVGVYEYAHPLEDAISYKDAWPTCGGGSRTRRNRTR